MQPPNLLQKHHYRICEVDMLRILCSYRPVLHSKKWQWNIFYNFSNMGVVACYILRSATQEKDDKLTNLEFFREVTMARLKIPPTNDERKLEFKFH